MVGARPVVMSKAMRLDFVSELSRRSYSISVALPLGDSPEEGSPVLYVLDGEWYFASAVEAVRLNAPGAVVVGIGYPESELYVESVLERHRPLPLWARGLPPFRAAVGFERMYDLSLPVDDEVLSSDFCADWWKIRAKDVGGLDAFLEVLELEIKSRVAATVRINPVKQAIFGHSLGGLAVLRALFLQRSTFRTFIAASPAIWWNEKAVLCGEKGFTDAVRAGSVAARVLITMGSEEQVADPALAANLGIDFGEFAHRIRKHRMVDNGRELTERLKSLCSTGGFEVEAYVVFPRQGHGISPWPALGRAVSFAFPP